MSEHINLLPIDRAYPVIEITSKIFAIANPDNPSFFHRGDMKYAELYAKEANDDLLSRRVYRTYVKALGRKEQAKRRAELHALLTGGKQ